MEEQKYRIGDVAGLIGMSRDTLRYYEKRGILPSHKEENGYRYYTDQDVSRLLGILYQRKMNFGLTDIESVWSGSDYIGRLSDLIDSRIDEELQAIRAHRQTIARLRLSQEDCAHIRHGLNRPQVTTLAPLYVIVPQCTQQESIPLWFRYANEYPGMDMMYIFDEYRWQQAGSELLLSGQNSQLILYESLREFVEYPFPADAVPTVENRVCATTYCTSPTRQPAPELVLPLIQWAQAQDLIISDRLYCTFAMQGVRDGRHTWFLQLYLPVH